MSHPIVLYTSPNCLFCDQAKSYLDIHKFDYETRDVKAPEYATEREWLKSIGVKKTPAVFYRGEELVGGGSRALRALAPHIIKNLMGQIDAKKQ